MIVTVMMVMVMVVVVVMVMMKRLRSTFPKSSDIELK
jgi:hypothetical protein